MTASLVNKKDGTILKESDSNRITNLIRSGRYQLAEGGQAFVRMPDGGVSQMDAAGATEMIYDRGSYMGASDAAKAIEREEYSSGYNTAAGLLGLFDYGTLGMGTAAVRAMSDDTADEIEKIQRYNPGVYHGTGIIGSIAAALMTGGGSVMAQGAARTAQTANIARAAGAASSSSMAKKILLGKVATDPASRLGAKAGQVITQMNAPAVLNRAGIASHQIVSDFVKKHGTHAMIPGLGRSFAELAPTTAKLTSGVAGLTAAGIVEGGLYGAGEGLSEVSLGDIDDAAEHILAKMGTGAFMGMAGGAGFGLGIPAIGKATTGIAKATGGLYDLFASSAVSKASTDALARISGKMLHKSEEEIQEMMRYYRLDEVGRKARDEIKELTHTITKMGENMGRGAQETVLIEEILQQIDRGGMKKERILEMARDSDASIFEVIEAFVGKEGFQDAISSLARGMAESEATTKKFLEAFLRKWGSQADVDSVYRVRSDATRKAVGAEYDFVSTKGEVVSNGWADILKDERLDPFWRAIENRLIASERQAASVADQFVITPKESQLLDDWESYVDHQVSYFRDKRRFKQLSKDERGDIIAELETARRSGDLQPVKDLIEKLQKKKRFRHLPPKEEAPKPRKPFPTEGRKLGTIRTMDELRAEQLEITAREKMKDVIEGHAELPEVLEVLHGDPLDPNMAQKLRNQYLDQQTRYSGGFEYVPDIKEMSLVSGNMLQKRKVKDFGKRRGLAKELQKARFKTNNPPNVPGWNEIRQRTKEIRERGDIDSLRSLLDQLQVGPGAVPEAQFKAILFERAEEINNFMHESLMSNLITKGTASDTLVQKLETISRRYMKNSHLFGGELSEYKTVFDDVRIQYAKIHEKFSEQFGIRVGTRDYIDPKAISTWISGLNKGNVASQTAHMREHTSQGLKALDMVVDDFIIPTELKFSQAVQNFFEDVGITQLSPSRWQNKEGRVLNSRQLIEEVRERLHSSGAELQDQVEFVTSEVSNALKWGAASGSAANARNIIRPASFMGYFGGFTLGAAINVIEGIQDPALGITRLHALETIAIEGRKQADHMVDTYINYLATGGEKGYVSAPSRAFIGAAISKREDPRQTKRESERRIAKRLSQEQYDDARDFLVLMASNPAQLDAFADASTKHLGNSAPETREALKELLKQKVMYAHSALPPTSMGGLFDAPNQPSTTQMAKFARVLEAVDDPIGAMAWALTTGTLTREVVQAIEATSPKFFTNIRLKIMEKLSDPKVSANIKRHDKLVLAQLFNISTTTPRLSQRLRENMKPAEEGQRGPTASVNKPMDQLSSGMAGPMEQILAR